VRMAKTGNPVMLKLPEFLLAKLKALPLFPGERYFAAASAALGTATGNARRTLRKLSALAGIRNANPHRFRDSLAIDLLSRGVAIEDVSEVLGHRDVKITLKHYANWVPERQARLDRAIDALG
jgi:integrase